MATVSVRRASIPNSHQHHHHKSVSSPSSSSSLRSRARALTAPSIPYHPPLLLRLLLFFFASGFVLGLTLFSSPYKHQHQPQANPSHHSFNHVPEPKLIIVVTPTYNRAAQAYFLHRLAQTLRLVPPPLLWIVVEMGSKTSTETASILRRSGVMYRHISCKHTSGQIKDRGVHQRNKALDLIEYHRMEGIVYFADDDNIYSLELFDHLRDIRGFGTWPVAMLTHDKSKAILEGPVCKDGKILGWHTNEKSKRLRRFHVDMSGFAFNSTMLWDPDKRVHLAWNTIRQLDSVKEGFQETTFIQQLVEDETQMEGLPSDCAKILNWHLHLDYRDVVYPKDWHLGDNLHPIVPLEL